MTEEKGHFVYIVRCRDGSLYTGYTVNIAKRIVEHNRGTGAKYTRGRRPVSLVYYERGTSRQWGLRRERAIKRLTRAQKLSLIQKEE